MINLFKKIFYFYFFYKFLIFKFKSNLKLENFDFQFILFSDDILLKKFILSKNYIEENIYLEKNNIYHSFDWLNISKKIGGKNNIKRSASHIINWPKKNYKLRSIVWQKKLITKRLINLLYNYDYFSILSKDKEKKILTKIIYKHFLMLSFYIRNSQVDSLTIEDLKAFFLGCILFQDNTEYAKAKIIHLIESQIDQNGFHKSYNSLTHSEFINHLYELKNIFLFFKIEIHPLINFQLSNMLSLLLNLFHKDGSICLFNGASNDYIDKIYEVLKTSKDLLPKNIDKFNTGIAIYGDKNKKLFMDIVTPLSKTVNSNLHAGTLSFELSINKEKIITNCGSINKRTGKNPEYLRYSAAHSTIILNNTNISELINKKSYTRTPTNITFDQDKHEKFTIWQSSHNGYLNNYKKIIKRKLKIYCEKNLIEGEDSFLSTKITSKKMIYHIRFHLMPDCNCILTNSKKNVLIKTKFNQSLIFKSDSPLSIEDSIYVEGQKQIKHTKQIVITGHTEDKKKIEKWSINQI